MMSNNWRSLEVGDKVSMHVFEFDGTVDIDELEITSVDNERAIAYCDGVNYWIDDDTEYMFHSFRK